jgi:beta-glucosidase
MTNVCSQVAGIVQCLFPGHECGHSIAKISTGAINPSSRLPMTWLTMIEEHASYGSWPADENNIIQYKEGMFVGY